MSYICSYSYMNHNGENGRKQRYITDSFSKIVCFSIHVLFPKGVINKFHNRMRWQYDWVLCLHRINDLFLRTFHCFVWLSLCPLRFIKMKDTKNYDDTKDVFIHLLVYIKVITDIHLKNILLWNYRFFICKYCLIINNFMTYLVLNVTHIRNISHNKCINWILDYT